MLGANFTGRVGRGVEPPCGVRIGLIRCEVLAWPHFLTSVALEDS